MLNHVYLKRHDFILFICMFMKFVLWLIYTVSRPVFHYFFFLHITWQTCIKRGFPRICSVLFSLFLLWLTGFVLYMFLVENCCEWCCLVLEYFDFHIWNAMFSRWCISIPLLHIRERFVEQASSYGLREVLGLCLPSELKVGQQTGSYSSEEPVTYENDMAKHSRWQVSCAHSYN